MKPETRNSFKENTLLIVSYVLSKILQFLFKSNVYIFGLDEGDENIILNVWDKSNVRWTHKNPFSGEIKESWYSSYYYDPSMDKWDNVGGRYLYGRFSHAIKPTFIGKPKVESFWMLELGKGKVQEIDVVEFMSPKGKRGVYFSIYNNEMSNRYYVSDTDKTIIYRRFQTRMRSKFICDYLSSKKINYSIKWRKNYVVWYIDDYPVAISFVYIPVQPMYLILSNIS